MELQIYTATVIKVIPWDIKTKQKTCTVGINEQSKSTVPYTTTLGGFTRIYSTCMSLHTLFSYFSNNVDNTVYPLTF